MQPSDTFLEVRDLHKSYPAKKGLGKHVDFVAVDEISFEIERGETWGLIGESGSGKTTTGRMVMALEKPTGGVVTLGGVDVTRMAGTELRRFRKRMQIVFQDSGSTFNPRRSVGDQIAFSIVRHGVVESDRTRSRVVELLERVGLTEAHYDRYIHELSGGQRQRLGICRALATEPDFLLLDEPTAALDVSVQAQILNLLKDLQAERGLTMLLITHDLSLVEYMCNRAGVLDKGKLVEQGDVDDLFTHPRSAVTRTLLDAVLDPTLPAPDPTIDRSTQ
ncbi:ATP-binding cassette domain-containing protein [Herbiconiux sp. CPCC 205716]|uniref:ATP-binding cassette domain-containing protein n=1 Tax=Herbiconiux gentiana TaxID=2970912 RepID=A0ABT2GAF5_9MICO|nr:ATP-binding cassette domain-containing protein [Herbiconiux gentiana]MCS5713184.1 ATP-binding cassette domain-containing protein [Herbiconiux gentiana]